MHNKKICNLALTCGRIAYELGYGADTMFHRTYFLLLLLLNFLRLWDEFLVSRHIHTHSTTHSHLMFKHKSSSSSSSSAAAAAAVEWYSLDYTVPRGRVCQESRRLEMPDGEDLVRRVNGRLRPASHCHNNVRKLLKYICYIAKNSATIDLLRFIDRNIFIGEMCSRERKSAQWNFSRHIR